MIEKIFTAIIIIPALIYSFVIAGVVNASAWLMETFRLRQEFSLSYTEDNIIEVSIVSIYYDENGKPAINEIRKVEDIAKFMEDFRAVEYYGQFAEPGFDAISDVDETTKLIKISYANGDFDLIGYHGSGLSKAGEGEIKYLTDFGAFDKCELDALTEKYSLSG